MAPPINDACSAATVISALPYNATAIVTEATADGGDPAPTADTGATFRTTWFQWVASSADPVTLNTEGSDHDVVITILTGACGALTEVASSYTSLAFTPVNGTTYRIMLSTWDDYGDSRVFDIRESVDPPAINDPAGYLWLDDFNALTPITTTYGNTDVSSVTYASFAAAPVSTTPLNCNGGVAMGQAGGQGQFQKVVADGFHDYLDEREGSMTVDWWADADDFGNSSGIYVGMASLINAWGLQLFYVTTLNGTDWTLFTSDGIYWDTSAYAQFPEVNRGTVTGAIELETKQVIRLWWRTSTVDSIPHNPANADGAVKMWVNGTLIFDVSGIMLRQEDTHVECAFGWNDQSGTYFLWNNVSLVHVHGYVDNFRIKSGGTFDDDSDDDCSSTLEPLPLDESTPCCASTPAAKAKRIAAAIPKSNPFQPWIPTQSACAGGGTVPSAADIVDSESWG